VKKARATIALALLTVQVTVTLNVLTMSNSSTEKQTWKVGIPRPQLERWDLAAQKWIFGKLTQFHLLSPSTHVRTQVSSHAVIVPLVVMARNVTKAHATKTVVIPTLTDLAQPASSERVQISQLIQLGHSQ